MTSRSHSPAEISDASQDHVFFRLPGIVEQAREKVGHMLRKKNLAFTNISVRPTLNGTTLVVALGAGVRASAVRAALQPLVDERQQESSLTSSNGHNSADASDLPQRAVKRILDRAQADSRPLELLRAQDTVAAPGGDDPAERAQG